MSMIDTLNYYIEQAEADLEGLSWDIREETNYEGETHDLMMNDLCDSYDHVKLLLEDLQKIKSELEKISELEKQIEESQKPVEQVTQPQVQAVQQPVILPPVTPPPPVPQETQE